MKSSPSFRDVLDALPPEQRSDPLYAGMAARLRAFIDAGDLSTRLRAWEELID